MGFDDYFDDFDTGDYGNEENRAHKAGRHERIEDLFDRFTKPVFSPAEDNDFDITDRITITKQRFTKPERLSDIISSESNSSFLEPLETDGRDIMLPEKKRILANDPYIILFDGAKDKQSFNERKIPSLSEYITRIGEQKNISDVVRFILNDRGGNILFTDFAKIIEYFIDDLELPDNSPCRLDKNYEIPKYYGILKTCAILNKGGYVEMSWENMHKAFSRIPLKDKRSIFRYAHPWRRGSYKNFPQPPEELKKGKHHIMDMLMCLGREYALLFYHHVAYLGALSIKKAQNKKKLRPRNSIRQIPYHKELLAKPNHKIKPGSSYVDLITKDISSFSENAKERIKTVAECRFYGLDAFETAEYLGLKMTTLRSYASLAGVSFNVHR